ncbi:hypothetical protein AB0V93_33295, partial [Mesorhizobium ciceri]|uniref:hypothetical protein n=1 Tax=Mesorhizobium ciceri TaxID=39645 RepID=UPI00345002FE
DTHRELTQGTGITKDLVPQDEAVLQEEALAWIAKRTTDGAVLYKQEACTSGRLRTTQDGGLRTTSGRSHGHLQDGELIEKKKKKKKKKRGHPKIGRG